MTINDYKFAGKKAIVRVDFNVPLNENGVITDDTRIRGALPTIKKILADGGSAILMSHMGRPKQNPDPKFSLKQIISAIEKNLGQSIQFCDDCMKAEAQAAALKAGEVLLLENLRFYEEEEGKPRGEFASDEEKKAVVNNSEGLTEKGFEILSEMDSLKCIDVGNKENLSALYDMKQLEAVKYCYVQQQNGEIDKLAERRPDLLLIYVP